MYVESGFGLYEGSYRSRCLESVLDWCREVVLWSATAPPLRPPLPPRARFGVADLELGGVRFPGLEFPDLLWTPCFCDEVAAAGAELPNSSFLRSSYLRCFSSRSLAACACLSASVSSRAWPSSSSSEDSWPAAELLLPSFKVRSDMPVIGGRGGLAWIAGPFLDRRTVGGLYSDRMGTTLRDSRK